MKVFYKSNRVRMCPCLMKENALDQWITYFKLILDMPCKPHHQPPTYDTNEIGKRNEDILWKLKGRVSRITFTMFEKYSFPEKVDNKIHIKMFSQNFNNHYSIPLLESHLQILFSHQTNFVSTKTLNYSIRFISESITRKNTMEKLKPYMKNIICDTIIPLLMIT